MRVGQMQTNATSDMSSYFSCTEVEILRDFLDAQCACIDDISDSGKNLGYMRNAKS